MTEGALAANVRRSRSTLAHPRIDRGPAMEPEPPDPSPPRRVHPAQRHDLRTEPTRDPNGPRRTQPNRALMRSRRVDRRHEQRIGPRALACQGLAPAMRRPRPDPARACATMNAVGANRRGPGHHQHQSPRVRQPSNPSQQHASLSRRRRVMAKHHPRSGRQSPERGPQGVAHPLVGHQPALGDGLSNRHVAAYSAGHDI